MAHQLLRGVTSCSPSSKLYTWKPLPLLFGLLVCGPGRAIPSGEHSRRGNNERPATKVNKQASFSRRQFIATWKLPCKCRDTLHYLTSYLPSQQLNSSIMPLGDREVLLVNQTIESWWIHRPLVLAFGRPRDPGSPDCLLYLGTIKGSTTGDHRGRAEGIYMECNGANLLKDQQVHTDLWDDQQSCQSQQKPHSSRVGGRPSVTSSTL